MMFLMCGTDFGTFDEVECLEVIYAGWISCQLSGSVISPDTHQRPMIGHRHDQSE
jgi:hypothetical protein